MSTLELEALCAAGKSFYARGYAHGSTGNLSVRIGDRVHITAGGGSLMELRPEALAVIDLAGRSLNQQLPSKEAPFHLAVYRSQPAMRAIVHLHSPWSVALSCLENPEVTPVTPYFVMRVAPLGIVPYFRPGSPELAKAVEATASRHQNMLLRNHGPICAGGSVSEAVDRAEELEATARLHFTLRGEKVQPLTPTDVEALMRGNG
ncbi:MAG TPA: class II aldolase/adducin family protein [Polyangiaceae bacterium]|jgi:ribulose-5-phosphate 4-epimerase/fuculose-1-phosphate aldolase